jgi:outer membrane protein
MINVESFRRSLAAALGAAALLFALPVSAQSQLKIATVDLKKIFEGYYKTKQADAQLRERGVDAEKQFKGMLDDYQKANEDYKKLVESANDQAVSSEEREKRKKSAEGKVLELNDLEKTINQFKREKQATFDEQKLRMRDQIVREIREIINNKARASGYTLVLDTSAMSLNQAPVVLFNTNQNDLTDEILKQMNLPAPPGVLDDENGKSTRGDVKLNIPDQDREKPSKKK